MVKGYRTLAEGCVALFQEQLDVTYDNMKEKK